MILLLPSLKIENRQDFFLDISQLFYKILFCNYLIWLLLFVDVVSLCTWTIQCDTSLIVEVECSSFAVAKPCFSPTPFEQIPRTV